MLPNLGINKLNSEVRQGSSLSPRALGQVENLSTSQAPLSHRLESSLTSGQFMTSFSGGFMALPVKELKDQLRVATKAEQMAKEKLKETKQQLEMQEEAHQKYKQDAESRIDNLKTENSMLQLSIKHMHDQNEALERSSTQSNNQDAFRIVEEYSKQNEQKSKEIEDLLNHALNKKTKHQQLKKLNAELELRLSRLQSKLDNMSKFCRIFIKSTKMQNQSLRDTVQQQHKDFSSVFLNCKQDINDQIQTKFMQIRLQYDQLLSIEKENVSNLKLSLSKSDEQVSEKLKQTATDLQAQMHKEMNLVQQKNTKLRQKLAELKVSQSDADEQSTAHQIDVLNLQIQSLKQKYELQISEKDNQILGLRETLQSLQARESALNSKLETVDAKSRQEYQRLVEMYEGSSRFKDIRDLYEEKINLRDAQILESKQDLVKCQVRLEVANEGIENYKQREQKLKQKASDSEQALQDLKTSSQQSLAALQLELQQLKASQQIEMQSFMMNQAKEFEEEVVKSKQQMSAQQESVISDLKAQLTNSKQYADELQQKVNDLTGVLTVTRDGMEKLNQQMKQSDQKKQAELDSERAQTQSEINQLRQENRDLIAQSKIQEKALIKQIEDLKTIQKEETMAQNWELDDLRQKLTLAKSQPGQSQVRDSKKFANIGTNTEQKETQDVSIEAIIINTSMAESVSQQKQVVPRNVQMQATQPKEQLQSVSKRPTGQQMAFIPQQPAPQKLLELNQAELTANNNKDQATSAFLKENVTAKQFESNSELVTQTSPQSSAVEETKSNQPRFQDQKPIVKPLNEPQTQEAAPSRFYSIISSFMSILSRRKQAFTGKPSSAMYYCKEKNRWIIQGEEESEDEAPPPPPPKAKQVNIKPDETLEQKQEQKQPEAIGLNSLTQPAFGGALANRNRARKPVATQQKLPPSFPAPASQLITEKKSEVVMQKQETVSVEQIVCESDRMNETDLNMTTYTARDYLSQTIVQEQQLQDSGEIEQLRQRENELEHKCNTQNEKILQLRSQIQSLQDALQNEKKMSQQTIVELESFSNEMQEAGQQHQKQLNEVTEALGQCQDKLSVLEATSWLAEENFRVSEQELQDTKDQLRNLKQKFFTLELQQQIGAIQREMESDEQILKPATVSQLAYNELEDTCETLKWQLAVHQQNTVKSEDQAVQLRLENTRLLQIVTSLKADQRDFALRIKELQERHDRDKQLNKEAHQRVVQEKEMLQEILKKSNGQMQLLARKFEADKLARQQEYLKLSNEKDVAYQQKLEAFELQKNAEIQAMQQQLETHASQLQTQVRHEQSRIKKQINSLESVLSKKDEDLQVFIGRNEEAQQELQSMGEMRQKLNDHIIYLQNEIRKRDELLEDGSDFEDDQELADDSYCSVGHTSSSQIDQASTPKKRASKQSGTSKYLEEARNQIKQLINGKLAMNKEINALNQQLRSAQSGLEQIFYLFEADSDMSGRSINEVVQVAIAKFFQMRNDYESKQMELQHQIDQLGLQVDNTESLNFEIQLLTGERDMLQADFNEMSQNAQQLTIDLEAATENFENQMRKKESEAAAQEELFRRQISMREQSQEVLREELHGQISDLRQKIAKKDDYVGQLEAHSKSMLVDQEQYQLQINELQKKLVSANQTREDSSSHFEMVIDELQSEKNELEQQLSQVKLQKSTLVKQMGDLEESLQEKIQELGQSNERLETLNTEFDNVAKAFMQKKENYKQTILKLKAQSTSEDSQQVTELKAQLAQADNLIQQMQLETEQIVKRMQEKKSQREAKLKEKIVELTSNNEALTEEIEKIRSQSQADESSQIGLVRKELNESISFISELKTQIANYKQAYQTLQEQHSQEIETIQQEIIKKCEENENLKGELSRCLQANRRFEDQINTKEARSTEGELEIEQLLTQCKQLQQENVSLKENVLSGEERLIQIESQYQNESQKLAEMFKQKQLTQREKTQQLKQEMRNLISQCQELETKLQTSSQEAEALRSELKHIQEEKLNLSQSLDLTKIQTNKEITQMQAERKLFESELEEQIKYFTERLGQIITLLDPEAVVVDPSQQALELVLEWQKNAQEDKRSLQRLVQEKDELQYENDGLLYKIQILVQERDNIQHLLSLTENAGLARQVKTLEEERSELRNDFVIKMDSMSQEMSILQDKISKYEGGQVPAYDSPKKEVKAHTGNHTANYKLEADQKEKAAQSKQTSFLASLFLTNSDLSK